MTRAAAGKGQMGAARVFVYLRTSTDEQDESPAIQEKRARDFCDQQGWGVAAVYYEIGSGKTPLDKRPQFQKMLAEAGSHGVGGFVALTFNRFLRSTAVAAQMEARLRADGLFIYGVDDKMGLGDLPSRGPQRAGEKAMRNVTVAMDQYYSDFISDKIRDHHEHRVGIRLHHSGAPPFGYRVKKDAFQVGGRWYDGWVPDDAPDGSAGGMTVAVRLRWIIERFLLTENLMDVAVELTQLGVHTPRLVQWNRLSESEKARRLEIQAKNKAAGHAVMALPPTGTWDSSVLSDMMRSKAYLGMIAYTPDHAKVAGKQKAKAWHEGRHEPLITPELHERVVAILEQRHQARRKPPTEGTQALLTGMLLCQCGNALTRSPKGQGTNVCRYVCNLKKKSRGAACGMPGVNSALVDPLVLKLLLRGMQARVNEIRAAAPPAAGEPTGDELEIERRALVLKRDRVLENFEDGLFGDGAIARAARDAKLSPILKRLEALAAEMQPLAVSQDELRDLVTHVEAAWVDLPVATKREILRTYAPEGFKLTPERRLQAAVCGILLEVEIPTNPPTGPGVKYGGRKRQDSTAAQGDTASPLGVDPAEVHEEGRASGRRRGPLPPSAAQTLQGLLQELLPA